jgi:magnesium-transporting ATPase (P-type)
MNGDLELAQQDNDLKKFKPKTSSRMKIFFIIFLILILLFTLYLFRKRENLTFFVPNFQLPKYFERYLKTNQIHDLFEDYSIFHETAMTSFDDCQDLQARKVLIFKPFVSAGLGNNLVGLSSSFLVALLSGRVIFYFLILKIFMVNWQGQVFSNFLIFSGVVVLLFMNCSKIQMLNSNGVILNS